MSRKTVLIVLAVAVVGATLAYFSPAAREARFVNSLVERNLESRGGATAWGQVGAMRMAGRMDLGQDMVVPYTLEQKRPGMMCFEFEFEGEISTQCTDGEDGWKIAPFRGRAEPQAMTDVEYREFADSVDPYGVLYDFQARGIEIDYLGLEEIDDRDTHKLQVNLPRGGVRWLYLDVETALDVRLETPRTIAGREHLVETRYVEWQTIAGLLIPARQETRTVGDEDTHFVTVDSVTINPSIEDNRFHIPVVSGNGSGGTRS